MKDHREVINELVRLKRDPTRGLDEPLKAVQAYWHIAFGHDTVFRDYYTAASQGFSNWLKDFAYIEVYHPFCKFYYALVEHMKIFHNTTGILAMDSGFREAPSYVLYRAWLEYLIVAAYSIKDTNLINSIATDSGYKYNIREIMDDEVVQELIPFIEPSGEEDSMYSLLSKVVHFNSYALWLPIVEQGRAPSERKEIQRIHQVFHHQLYHVTLNVINRFVEKYIDDIMKDKSSGLIVVRYASNCHSGIVYAHGYGGEAMDPSSGPGEHGG